MSEADNKVVESSAETPVQIRQGVYTFMSNVEGEIFSVAISIEVLGQKGLEDRACDIQLELDEALQRVVVGNFKLTPVASGTTYTDTTVERITRSMERT